MSLSPGNLSKLEDAGLGVSDFPVVYMKLGQSSDLPRWLDGMSLLLRERTPFAIIVDGRPHDESDAVRRQRNLWFKAEMTEFQKYCCGFVQIETDPAHRAEQQDHADKMSAAFNMPMKLVETHEEALAVARDFLKA